MKISTLKLTGMFLLLLAIHVSAATRYVDLNSTNATPPFTDWTSAATNIQDAIDIASAGDFIVVSNGTYKTGGRTVNGYSLSNRVVINKAVTVQSVNGAAVTAIQGNLIGIGKARCVYMTNGAALAGFTLTNGWTLNSASTIFDQSGAGVWCESSGSVVSNCVFIGNIAERYGGGAFQGTILNCIFTNNIAAFGGAACSNVLFDCTMIQNKAQFNGANIGGGAYYCTLNNCLVVGNQSVSSGNGGGAAFSTLTSCVVSNNSAGNGGGLYFGSANNSLISSNRAGSGAGAYSNVLNNCVLINNVASAAGGGTFQGTLNNCTLIGNSSNLGGGAYQGILNNCIVYYNIVGAGSNYFGSALNYCCTLPLPAGGSGNITNEPMFVNLTTDFHLQSNSPCINAGNNSYVANATDFDGSPRIAGGTVDIGAYEFQSPSSVLSYAWAQQYGLPTDGSADSADTDSDGLNNWQEWIAGTVPTNSLSILSMFSPSNNVPGLKVSWQSVSGKTYFLQRSTNLLAQPAFTSIRSNLVGGASTTTYTDTTATNDGPYLYRVGVQ